MPNHIAYAMRYYRHLLEASSVEAPDPAQAGKHHPVLHELFQIRQLDGAETMKRAWDDVLSRRYPELRSAIARAEQSSLRLYRLAELRTLPPPEHLLGDVLIRGAFTVLYGASGVGKTFYALRLAVEVARKHRVVYFAGEGAQANYRDRLDALCAQHGLVAAAKAVEVCFTAVHLLDSAQINTLIEDLRLHPPALIVIDTLARAMLGGDENSARDMGVLVNNVERICTALNCTVLLVHHTGRNLTGERGSYALRAAADMMIEVKRRGEQIMVVCDKSRDASPFQARYYQLKDVSLSGGRTSCVAVRVEAPADGALTCDEQILNYLARSNAGYMVADLVKGTGIPEGTMYKRLSKLEQDGYVTQAKKRRPYMITDLGREALNANKH